LRSGVPAGADTSIGENLGISHPGGFIPLEAPDAAVPGEVLPRKISCLQRPHLSNVWQCWQVIKTFEDLVSLGPSTKSHSPSLVQTERVFVHRS